MRITFRNIHRVHRFIFGLNNMMLIHKNIKNKERTVIVKCLLRTLFVFKTITIRSLFWYVL